jgi:hypothetical protein
VGWADRAGVTGISPNGTGVEANSGGGYALVANGYIYVHRAAGVVTIAAGETSVVVRIGPKPFQSPSFVLLAPKGNLGGRELWYTRRGRTAFVVHISSPQRRDTHVGWLVIATGPLLSDIA